MSLLLIEAPRPKSFQLHDKVTILISEVSKQSANQKVDTKKDVSLKGGVRQLPDIIALLQGQLETDDGSPITGVDASAGNKFKGDGKYERSDRFTDRITATVIDVKPNGVLVLEARRTIEKDEELQTLVLSGECRREDVTAQNTVMSNQLADMVLSVKNEGQVKDAAEKGLLSRVFDTVFNF
jgi:flagellar L-ring protein precursor FlgH